MKKKTNKGVVAMLVIAAIAISLLLSRAFANATPYSITFTSGNGHGINRNPDDQQFYADGVKVVPVKADDGSAVDYTVQQEGETVTMTITNGESVKFQYTLPQGMEERGFDLFNNGALVDETTTTSAAAAYTVGDKYLPCTLTFACTSAEGNVLTYNVGSNNTAVTVTVPNDFTVTNKAITGNYNTIKNLTLTINNFGVGTMSVVLGGANNYSTVLQFNNGTVTLPGNSIPSEGPLTLSIIDTSNQQQDPGHGGYVPNPFDGNVYFMWTSGNNLCYHRFTGFTGVTSDDSYETNYVNVTALTDESGNGSNYTWGQEPANWVLARDVESSVGVLKQDVDVAYVFGDGQMDMGCQLDPCGAVSGKNSICTNGDMNFRATIYREGFETLQFGIDESDYTYFPWFLQGRFFSPIVDISGTTASNPAVYKTYLLEDSVIFNAGEFSEDVTITSVKPLDVNANAVRVYKIDGMWKVKFNSNYYDHVVFEITTANEKKYYIRIARISMYVEDNFAPDTTNQKVVALLSYPTNMRDSDFDVVATVVKKDGSKSTSIVAASKAEEDPRNTEAGKGLSMSAYAVDVNNEVAGVYFTAVYKGALEGDVYGGTFSGSGRGIYYDIEDYRSATFREMRFDM